MSRIIVSGEGEVTSVPNGGTLQMHAKILPADADDSAVIWSVIRGTGNASITSGGMLFTLEAGTVTVKATAHDRSGVSGTVKITISGQREIVPVPVVLGGKKHTWDTLLGGVIWNYSRSTNRKIASTLPELQGTVLVDLKTDANGFGYRFDLDSWEQDDPTHGWFPWDGSDEQPANLDELFQIYGAGDVKFVLNIPVPNYGTGPDQLPRPSAYEWQTPGFYGAECRYLFGEAGAPSEYRTLPLTVDFFSAPAGFNWANLRARRGHPAPYTVETVILGVEPYYVDGWGWDASAYGTRAELFRQAIRSGGIDVPYGVCLGNSLSHLPGSSYFDPLMDALSAFDRPLYYDLFHSYQFHIDPVWNRTCPVAVNADGFQYWPGSPSTWDMDYSRYLYGVDDARAALIRRGVDGGRLGWSEHGITTTSQFEWNDMSGAIHWATWLAEVMRLGTQWDSMWCLGGEGYATALIQVRETVIRPPAFHVYRMAMGLRGKTYVDTQYDSPMGSCVWHLPPDTGTVDFPWFVVRAFKDASGRLSLFVINQDPERSFRITGLESYRIAYWEQVSGSDYSDGDPFAPFHSEDPHPVVPVLNGPVAKDPEAPLVFDPISITRIDFQ